MENNQAGKHKTFRIILLILTLLSSPLCCLNTWLLAALPLPAGLFEAEVQVENRSGETVYLTPITTTTGRPEIILQRSFRQSAIPLESGKSVALTYDAADHPLDGVVVCRSGDECRVLLYAGQNLFYVDDFEGLPEVSPDWLSVVQSYDPNSFGTVLSQVLGFVPLVLLMIWLFQVVKLRR